MNKFTKQLSILGLAVVMSTPVFASTIGLNINNSDVKTTQSPVMEQGTTLVPLRVISENLGAKVDWNAKDKRVTVKKDSDTIILTIGSKQATVNGEVKTLPQAPKTINGTTMLPVRFVAENLKCEVIYDKGSNTVFVTSDGVTAEIPDTEGWRTTTIKNPKIINGVPYLTQAQMEKAFDVTIKDKKSNVATIERQDLVVWNITQAETKKSYNRINWTHVPTPKEGTLVIEGGQYYFPVQYLAPYLNATVDYDKASKELTTTYKGIKIHDTVDTQFNEIKGYVYTPDGKPAQGVQMRCHLVAFDKGEPLYTETDENGFYTFGEVDTVKHPTISIQAYGKYGSNPKMKNYFGELGGVLISTSDKPIYNFNDSKFYSNLKVIPDINMIDESIWN